MVARRSATGGDGGRPGAYRVGKPARGFVDPMSDIQSLTTQALADVAAAQKLMSEAGHSAAKPLKVKDNTPHPSAWVSCN